MSVYVIADLHLATADSQKSMEVFGKRWKNYIQRIRDNWQRVITDSDTVIIPGDISWGLATSDALDDLLWLESLSGTKVIMKGNHDFWWSTVSKLNSFFEQNNIKTIKILNNNALEIENYIIAGSRGWFTDKSMQNTEEDVDYDKIVNRESIRLKMSLDEAIKLRGETDREIVVFLHFPPVWGEFVCRPIINLLKEYNIKRCYFGHIHSVYSYPETFEFENVKFHIISADFLDFLPRIV
ncbi:MAG: serine/threonine protein phosphatase [Ruminococcaceae bacterium]|nr:serine/threonine protein phosphatase [Oscillospiraceae bacterium]MBE6706139.1 serine/threonine protein phosphatase [Oscillospiraceae bacterium]